MIPKNMPIKIKLMKIKNIISKKNLPRKELLSSEVFKIKKSETPPPPLRPKLIELIRHLK
jgi:hypothetical protein